MLNTIIDSVNDYYTAKIKEHGVTPRGVDWNSSESQHLRFGQLCRVIDPSSPFSVLDYGCGYGAMYDYMAGNFKNFEYTGFDISEEMIKQAKATHLNTESNWLTSIQNGQKFDYTIASGIFNVRLENTNEDWQKYILETLHNIDAVSTRGFSFNVLTSYSDKEFMKDYLFYADPCFLFDYCKRNFSRFVGLLHDYPLYEFTINVVKIPV